MTLIEVGMRLTECNPSFWTISEPANQDPVVQRVDSAIRWINHYPLDNAINFDSTYPLDSDLSSG